MRLNNDVPSALTRRIQPGSSLSPQKSSVMNAACNSYSNVTCIILIAMNSGRGWHGQFFFSGYKTGDGGENVPPSQAFKTVNNGPAFPQEDNFLLFYFFDAPGFRFPKARPQKASRKYRSSDYVGPIPSHSCRPKLLLYWNLVIKGNY